MVAEAAAARGVDPGWVALKLLEGDGFAEALAGRGLKGEIERHGHEIETACGDEADIIIADGRYRFIGDIIAACFHQPRKISLKLTRRIDRVVLNRFLGVPVFLFAMYLMFLFTIKVGGAFIEFFGLTAEALFVDGVGAALKSVDAPEWLTVFVATGIGGGIKTVATFIPIIGSLFLFLSFLEDSGYMARAAFVMDRAMRAIGLPGKSFVPLIVGFGCNVPAIMATRTLENRRDRILTMMMAPFMSCGARLPVYALFAAAFFTEQRPERGVRALSAGHRLRGGDRPAAEGHRAEGRDLALRDGAAALSPAHRRTPCCCKPGDGCANSFSARDR